jgi:hypothetical protein
MSPWCWVLAGLAAWLTPGVLVVLMLGWVLWRHPEKPAKHRKPPQVGSNVDGCRSVWYRSRQIREDQPPSIR